MRMFVDDLKKNFLTIKTLICTISVVIVSLLCFNQDLLYIFTNTSENSTSIIELIDYLLGIGIFRNLILIIISVPFVEVFCEDWNNKNIYSVITRCNIKKYSKVKILSSVVGAISVSFIGFLLLAFLLSFFMPLSTDQTVNNFVTEEPYGFLVNGYPFIYLIVRLLIFSIFSSIWVIVGLFFSTIIPNNFVSLAIPLISYYFIGNLCDYLPKFININYLTNCTNILGGNAIITFVYSLLFFIVLILVFIKLFNVMVQRRINNEFN